MLKTLSLILVLVSFLIPDFLIPDAWGQQNQQRVATTTTVVTTQTVSAFQLALQSASRNSCTVQYNGAGTGFVYFGVLANATTQNSFQLTNKQTVMCVASGITITDAVSVTSTATADQFVVTTQ